MKKVLSVLLTAVMLFTFFVPAFAAEEENKAYEGYPLVIVRGIDFDGLYLEDGSPAIKISPLDIISYLLDCVNDCFINKKPEEFKTNTLEFVGNIFSPIASDNEGNSINKIVTEKFYTCMADYPEFVATAEDKGEEGLMKGAVDKIGAENVYYFTFDWRKSAKELATELKGLIDTALEASGKDKVNLACASMGGMVTTAYLYYYGSDALNNLTYISSAHNGTYYCGETLGGKVYFDEDALYNRLMDDTDNNIILDILMTLLRTTGIFGFTVDLVNKFVKDNNELVYNSVLRDSLGTAMGFWAMCPDDIFDSSVEFIFGGHEEEYPVIMDKLAETREFLFATEETIDSAIENGVNVTFTSNYGNALVPIFESATVLGDRLLETHLTSNFAVTSKHGETLSAEQIAAADPQYLSPDKCVDATPALYRDVTWFTKDAGHVSTYYGSDFTEFALWLTLAEEKLDIHSDERYPQFMKVTEDGKLVANK